MTILVNQKKLLTDKNYGVPPSAGKRPRERSPSAGDRGGAAEEPARAPGDVQAARAPGGLKHRRQDVQAAGAPSVGSASSSGAATAVSLAERLAQRRLAREAAEQRSAQSAPSPAGAFSLHLQGPAPPAPAGASSLHLRGPAPPAPSPAGASFLHLRGPAPPAPSPPGASSLHPRGPAPPAPAGASSLRLRGPAAPPASPPLDEDGLQQLTDMGFEAHRAQQALDSAGGNVETAVAILFSSSG